MSYLYLFILIYISVEKKADYSINIPSAIHSNTKIPQNLALV